MKIIASQVGKARVRFIARCLVILNTYGIIPIKFKNISIVIRAMKNVIDPPTFFVWVRKTSSCTVLVIERFMNDWFESIGFCFINVRVNIATGITQHSI